jgi:hypothetical protein
MSVWCPELHGLKCYNEQLTRGFRSLKIPNSMIDMAGAIMYYGALKYLYFGTSNASRHLAHLSPPFKPCLPPVLHLPLFIECIQDVARP